MTDLAAVVRFVHVTAAILLAGSFSFVLLIARPALLTGKDSARTNYQTFRPATAHDRSLLPPRGFSIGLTRALDPDRQRDQGVRIKFHFAAILLVHHGDSVRPSLVGAHGDCAAAGSSSNRPIAPTRCSGSTAGSLWRRPSQRQSVSRAGLRWTCVRRRRL